MHLSVVIATLSKPATACRLAERVQEIFPGLDIEVIVVTPPGVRCPESTSVVRHLVAERRGVYPAYSAGLRAASGEYVWLMGDDDYPLDAAGNLASHLQEGAFDVLVAPVVFSSGRLYKPTRNRVVLFFVSWCQQGVVYRRQLLLRHRFYRRLLTAADQFVNVQLRCDPNVRVRYLSDPVCLFGLNGISGRVIDHAYRTLRPALARRILGPGSFLLFRGLLSLEPLVKRLVKLR